MLINRFNIIKKVDVLKFIYLNFICKKISGEIKPYKGSIIELNKGSKIKIGENLFVNSHKLTGSKKEVYLSLKENSIFKIKKTFNIYYDVDICLYKDAILEIGSGFINAGSQIRCLHHIVIGEGVAIARGVKILDSDAHEIYFEDGKKHIVSGKIKIGNKVWIGTNATILKGVTIGDNSIVAAGSIVTKNVPEGVIVAGNPAKVIRKIDGWK